MAERDSTITRKILSRPRTPFAALSSALCALIFLVGISLLANTPAAADDRQSVTYEKSADTLGGSPTLDTRDDEYSTEYFFGLSRSVAGSTLNAGVKTLFFVFTIPVDIVVLPFAAIGGFF